MAKPKWVARVPKVPPEIEWLGRHVTKPELVEVVCDLAYLICRLDQKPFRGQPPIEDVIDTIAQTVQRGRTVRGVPPLTLPQYQRGASARLVRDALTAAAADVERR